MKTFILLIFTLLSASLHKSYGQCHLIHPDDLAFLRSFYISTNGKSWSNASGWNQILSDNPKEICALEEIFGVEFHQDGEHRLRRINFQNTSNLTGHLPPVWENLIGLERVQIAYESVGGELPREMNNLPSLYVLSIRFTEIHGTIPAYLGNLSRLATLHFYENQLSGPIPPELGLLSNLNTLSLSRNELTGTIPEELGNLSRLFSLNVRGNNLHGQIPSSLGNLSDLIYLSANQNNLSGVIPTEIGNCSNLKSLRLSRNNLRGSIPPSLGNLTSLEYLGLNDNYLSGAIPNSLGSASSLQTLYLSYNQLSGPLPPTLGALSNLDFLTVRRNNLSGCLDLDLLQLCGAEVNIEENQFPTTWSEFCQAGNTGCLDCTLNCPQSVDLDLNDPKHCNQTEILISPSVLGLNPLCPDFTIQLTKAGKSIPNPIPIAEYGCGILDVEICNDQTRECCTTVLNVVDDQAPVFTFESFQPPFTYDKYLDGTLFPPVTLEDCSHSTVEFSTVPHLSQPGWLIVSRSYLLTDLCGNTSTQTLWVDIPYTLSCDIVGPDRVVAGKNYKITANISPQFPLHELDITWSVENHKGAWNIVQQKNKINATLQAGRGPATVVLTITDQYGTTWSCQKTYRFTEGSLNTNSHLEQNNSANTYMLSAQVYPNPVRETLDVGLSKVCSGTIQIYDIRGQILKEKTFIDQQQLKIDCSTLAAGFHTLRISSSEGALAKKIVVQ